MKEKQRRRIIALCLFIVVLFLAKSVWGVWQKNVLARNARAEIAAELASLKDRHDALDKRVGRLETPRGEEEELRRNFPVVKVGEKVIVIVDEEASNTGATSTDSWFKKLFQRD